MYMENYISLALRDRIIRFENLLKTAPQVEIETRHYFSHGVYAREIIIPAGTWFTGGIHRYENLNIVSKGRITVVTEEGIREITAPATFVSPAGTKRAAYVSEDTVWTTILGTHERDIEKIKTLFLANSYSELDVPMDASLALFEEK